MSQFFNDMSIRKRANQYWIDFSYNRVRYRKSSPENSYAGAKAYEAVMRQKLARGEPIEITIEKPNMAPTFNEFSQKWLDVYVKTNNKQSEVTNKESILRAHLVPFFGSKLIDQISGLDIENFKAKEIKAGLSNKSINNFLIVISRCLKVAHEWDIIEKVPKIKLLKVKAQQFDFLSESECQSLLDNCNGLLRDMILIALKTGLRFGELIALQWSDIDFESKILTVRQSIYRGELGGTKSNKIRYVPLLDEVQEILLTRFNKNAFVFSLNNKEPLSHMLCLRWLHRACIASDLRKIGWHTLRHTFASQLAQNGVSITIVKELLGHSDIRTTMRYSHLTSSAIKDAIFSLNSEKRHNSVTISNANRGKLYLPVSMEA